MAFRDKLNDAAKTLDDLATEAGGLANQNLADILRMGSARIAQALQHPDVDRVGQDAPDQPAHGGPLNSGGNALFAAGDPGSEAARTEAARRATFPGGPYGAPTNDAPGYVDQQSTLPVGAPVPGVTPVQPTGSPAPQPFPGTEAKAGDADAKHPGDPDFQQTGNPNPPPSQVDLNKDGTLKTAPMVAGTSDERDGGKKE